MHSILIRSHESNLTINCGLDPATDALRQLFKLDLSAFRRAFENKHSPARWLYYLLSNQLHIAAKLHTLDYHMTVTKEKMQIQAANLRYAIDNGVSASEEKKCNAQFDRIDQLKEVFGSIEERLSLPKNQLETLKELRFKKIKAFTLRYHESCKALATALIAGGLTDIDNKTIRSVMAFLFQFEKKQSATKMLDGEKDIYHKIKDAVKPAIAHAFQPRVLCFLLAPYFWKKLGCQPSLPVALEITPVLITILEGFDEFRIEHAGLLRGVVKLKDGIRTIEKLYAQSIMNSYVDGILDASLQDVYPIYKTPSQDAPTLS